MSMAGAFYCSKFSNRNGIFQIDFLFQFLIRFVYKIDVTTCREYNSALIYIMCSVAREIYGP